MSESLYGEFKEVLQKIADLKYSSAVLQWDQETYLPKNGHEARGRQIATLNELAHEQFTQDKFGALLNDLAGRNDLSEKEKKNVHLSLDDFNRNKKLPSVFVWKMS